ncbi:GAF domain-containing protein [Geomonas sp. Red32]|uniref:MASE3 domain-containing protein n=1 Tax=Geomonas sp. Red32 TaxID=2912856 RepID=UPI00202CB3A6|nr:MASE3 domain-containing protein [Geomonas sp. Red32]MCM0081633.1 GAF domain-containing protein [Geomonas sp. Red32]
MAADRASGGSRFVDFTNDRSGHIVYAGAIFVVIAILYASSLHSYLLFHSLIEIFTIAIAFSLLTLTWNSRRFLTSGCIKAIGIGYGLIAIVDLIHALTYKGMGVFPAYGANLPTQLWIAARSLQALLLCVAPLYARRNLNEHAFLAVTVAATGAVTALIFAGGFPDCFIEGKGLTPFKIAAEYLISASLFLALVLFIRARSAFNARVFALLVAGIVCTIGSEVAFTSYISVYGSANMIGHFLKLAAFALAYRALIVTGVQEPFEVIFRDLKQAELALLHHQETLEEQVRERTVALETEVTEHRLAEVALSRLNRELRTISRCNEVLVRAEDEQTLLEEICRIVCEEGGYRMAWVGYARHDRDKTITPVARGGLDDGYLAEARITWADTGLGRGPSGTCIRNGTSACFQDFATDAVAAPWRERALERGYRSSASLPLKDETGATFGALTIYSSHPNAFPPDEIRLLEELAADLAFGIRGLRNHRARQEAERTTTLLEFALDNVREAAFLIDEQARFLYVNGEACRELGYRREELLTLGVADVDPDFPGERWSEHWAQLKEQRSLTFDGRHRTKDGRLVPVEISANYLEYDGHRFNLALTRDISERKRAEEGLRFLNAELEVRVKERTAELEMKNEQLEHANRLFVGRELRMVELKERIRALEEHDS